MQNAESSLSVGFTSLRDGKALWLMLTPKDGGTMQARTEGAWACGGWACGGHVRTMHTPCTYSIRPTHTPCTPHARTMQVLTEDMELAGEVLQDLCTFLQISELESVAEFPAEMEARCDEMCMCMCMCMACAYHVHCVRRDGPSLAATAASPYYHPFTLLSPHPTPPLSPDVPRGAAACRRLQRSPHQDDRGDGRQL